MDINSGKKNKWILSKMDPNKLKQLRGYCEDTGEFSAFVVLYTDIPASSLSQGVLIFYSQDNTGCFCFLFSQEGVGHEYAAKLSFKISRELKCLHAFIKFVKLATGLSFLGSLVVFFLLTELQSPLDKLIVCILYAETERKIKGWVSWTVG